MTLDRSARQAVARLGTSGVKALDFLQSIESESIVSVPELCWILDHPKIQLIGISCATGTEDEQSLNVANGVGFFSRLVRQRTLSLIEGLRQCGKEVDLTLFVQDLEFTRAWGWSSRSHEDLKFEAWLQIETAREAGKAPPGEIVFWSDVEPEAIKDGCISYQDALTWAAEPAQAKVLDADIRYRMSIPKLRTARRCELEPSSLKRVADYALVGEAFESLYPDAIFVQAADARTDHLLGLRRRNPLPIIHPWR